MSKQKMRTAITPTREENYAEWFQAVLAAAELAEHSPVRGCMVINPWGFAIWENMQKGLDEKIKETGHQNAYFPLFIPLSFFEKEAEHIDGFAKECAVVTHHKLEKNSEGKLVPTGELEEPLIVRPTSEMIIGHTFSKWVKSYRDLPLLINQWANVVRWEMRTRLFLRTTEFLWQEGHTVHANKEEAVEETKKMLDVYADFCHEYLALPVIRGEKTVAEKFPGAVTTYTIESMMQDKKALQTGTSHFLGQNFSKSCDIKFQNENSELEYGWTTSWGITTRLIGGLVMTHSDDDGLVLPPKIAPTHLVIIPVIHKEETRKQILDYAENLAAELRKVRYFNGPLKVIVDKKDERAGEKTWKWIKKGAPLRLEIGMREIESGSLSLFRRDRPHKEATLFSIDKVVEILDEMQENLFQKASLFREKHTRLIETEKAFYEFFQEKEGEDSGGFALIYFCEDPRLEEKIKKDLGVTARCIPLEQPSEGRSCIFTKKQGCKRVIFAKAY